MDDREGMPAPDAERELGRRLRKRAAAMKEVSTGTNCRSVDPAVCAPVPWRGVALAHCRWKRRVGGATAPGVGA